MLALEHATAPRWDEAYRSLAPKFLGILAILGRSGFSHGPADRLDIIHDFFVDEWAKIEKTHDSARGPLEPYATSAFFRYARRWLARGAAVASRTLEASEVKLGQKQEPLDLNLDLAHLRETLDRRMTSEDSELLLARYGDPPASERRLARQLGVSRYTLRDRMTTALARLGLALGETTGAGTEELEVLRDIFVHEEPPSVISARHHISTARVRRVRDSFVRYLRDVNKRS